jgi:hypothetical protein
MCRYIWGNTGTRRKKEASFTVVVCKHIQNSETYKENVEFL